MSREFPRALSADIALLLEGTYPFVRGGVSSWVHQIIKAFPDIRFAAIFIGSRPDDYHGILYELPDNLVHLEAHYIFAEETMPAIREMAGNEQGFDRIRRLHAWFRSPMKGQPDQEATTLPFFLDPGKGVDFAQFLYSKHSWEFIAAQYEQFCTDPSFVDYFWTVRNMHAPIWQLARVARDLIPVRACHTVSTGYAGFLGALHHHNTGRPLILSEHGIYTKERRIDLLQSQWIKDNRNAFQRDPTEISYYRELWIRFFETLGHYCYNSADTICSLFEKARARQIADGAPPERTRVIPNGIDIKRFKPLHRERSFPPPPVLCLLGRVVPIKDIRNFIRAMRTVIDSIPEAEGWIVGPTDEHPDYYQDCRNLAENLGLRERVKFLGFQQVTEILPRVGLLALSSISEGLPLAVLEAFATGLPAVTTDVGSCEQLVFGRDEEDCRIGGAGDVVGISNPQALAEACLGLLRDPGAWKKASEAAMTRVERYYTEEIMINSYREVYEGALTTWQE
jgi:glycosyltransferase involved in cell wall biosynthesis